jgi:hypothetical protein
MRKENSLMRPQRWQSSGVRRVLDGLKAAADANGMQDGGRYVQYGTGEERGAVLMGAAPGHPGEEDYRAAFADGQ